MELFRRAVLFLMGFVAAASIMIADDRMAVNYGGHPMLDVNEEVRQLAMLVQERIQQPEEIRDPKVLETFVTQKI
ncbi:MAG: hypothetical protein IKK22_05290 [Firmicutes bacterium]|nr:hypothetical protein [Bacillota bacterium]MBR4074814.1 hypothetical protein [Bacillota bacterium]